MTRRRAGRPERTATGADAAPALLTWDQVAAFRVRRHHLEARAPRAELVEVVRGLCGVHAQLMGSAELALWARVDGLEPGAVAHALWEERSLVKTWAMRGTLHLLPADELGLWHGALGTHRHYLKPAWSRAFGTSPEELEQLVQAVAAALGDGPLTREQLAAEVARRTGTPELGHRLRESWGAMLKPAAFRGHLCFAPGDGPRVRFAHPERWLGAAPRPVTPEAALAEVARRFLAVDGPATREDLARWWAMSPAAAGRVLRDLGDEVAAVDVEGAAAHALAVDVAGTAGASGAPPGGAGASGAAVAPAPRPSVRLLPAFDQYVVAATRHAERLMPGPFRDRVYRPQGWLSPVLLVDGRMEGTWRHERRGRRLEVALAPFRPQPAGVREHAEAEAERLAAFLGGELALRWGD
jgi:hypothetical protein